MSDSVKVRGFYCPKTDRIQRFGEGCAPPYSHAHEALVLASEQREADFEEAEAMMLRFRDAIRERAKFMKEAGRTRDEVISWLWTFGAEADALANHLRELGRRGR